MFPTVTAMRFAVNGEELAIAGVINRYEEDDEEFGFIFLYGFPDMMQLCSFMT